MALLERLPTCHLTCYVYGVVPGDSPSDYDTTGLGEAPVYCIRCGDVAAAVQDYAGESFDGSDAHRLESGLRLHQQVVETLMERSSVVLPVRFGTVFTGNSSEELQAAVRAWLETERSRFLSRMAAVAGHAEYGVKIFWQRRDTTAHVLRQDEALQSLQTEIAASPRGTRFLLQRRFEQALSRALEEWAGQCFQEVWTVLSRHSRSLEPETVKTENDEDWERMLQFSCLPQPSAVEVMERDLAAAADRRRLRYRLSGPWPPYSFV